MFYFAIQYIIKKFEKSNRKMNSETLSKIACFAFFCCIQITDSTLQHDQHGDYDVDEFIKKLMTSQRFDELADRIAEKAASKIKSFGKVDDRQLRNDEIMNEPEDDSVSPQKISEDHVNEEEQLKDANEKKSKFSDIDTKAYVPMDTSPPSEKLSLRYKYLLQNSPKQEKVEAAAPKRFNKDSQEKNYEKPPKRKNHKTLSYEELQSENYNEKYSKETKKHHSARPHKTYNHLNSERKAVSNVKSNRIKKSRKTKELPAISSSNEEFLNSEISQAGNQDTSETDDTQVTEIDDLKDKSEVFRSKTKPKLRKNIRNEKSQYNPDNNKEIHDSTEFLNNEGEITSSTVKIYRREGDREFTFQSSPDYAEYHEKISKFKEPNMEKYLKL